MSKVTSAVASFAFAAAALGGATHVAAQDKAKPAQPAAKTTAQPAAKTTELGSFLCKDVMRMSGEDRLVALGVLHGYFLGKKGATGYVPAALGKASDDFTEYCLDHPAEKAIDAFAKFAK